MIEGLHLAVVRLSKVPKVALVLRQVSLLKTWNGGRSIVVARAAAWVH